MSLSPYPLETALKTLETKAEDSISGLLSPPVAEKRQQEPDFLRQWVGRCQGGILAIDNFGKAHPRDHLHGENLWHRNCWGAIPTLTSGYSNI